MIPALVLLSLLDIFLLIFVLALYLVLISNRLNNINQNLADSSATVATIVGHVEPILPGVGQINRVLGVIAGALPLLWGLCEKITVKTGRA
jgi:hypothetical protein